jgi:hypothetical protein
MAGLLHGERAMWSSIRGRAGLSCHIGPGGCAGELVACFLLLVTQLSQPDAQTAQFIEECMGGVVVALALLLADLRTERFLTRDDLPLGCSESADPKGRAGHFRHAFHPTSPLAAHVMDTMMM